MKTIKIYDRPILNFYDLHKEFSPYEIFSQLVLFDEFAEVHCLPLRAHIKGRVAEVLTKEFWLKILRRHEWPSANNPEELFKKIFGSELNETAKSEISDAEIFAKLKYITESSGQNPVNVILMLAISELAEIDARKIDASQWQKSGEYRVKSDEIKTFDYEKIVTLPAGGVYRF